MSVTDAKQDERQGIIIKFIRQNPSCSAEDVIRGVKNDISRVTVFKILDKLKESGAVKRYLENNQKRNAREHRLFVDEGNPLVSVCLELEEFEMAYFDLFVRALKVEPQRILAIMRDVQLSDEVRSEISKVAGVSTQRIEQLYNNQKIIEPESRQAGILRFIEHLYNYYKLGAWHEQLVGYMLTIFYSMVDACLFRFLFIWTQKIPDQQVLQRLYSMVFFKIANMQTRLSEMVRGLTGARDADKNMERFIFERFRGSKGSKPMLQYLDSFKKLGMELGMENEIERLIDALWKIIGDLQPIVYPESKLYGENDWRKLVRLLKQHPESSPYDRYKS